MMRFKIICALLIMSGPLIKSQSLGTIKVNEHFSATCEFDHGIDRVFVSNNEKLISKRTPQGVITESQTSYNYIIDGNIVIFSAHKEQPSKSVTIRLFDGSTWYGVIEYDNEDRQIHYPYESENVTHPQEKLVSDSLTRIQSRLNYCLTEKTGFEGFGVNKNRIYWEINNIMADENFLYLKILVNNRSGHTYEIINGKADCWFEEGKSRNIKKDDARNEVDKLIVYNVGPEKIGAYSTEVIGYVIESYPVSSKGKLVLSFLEKGGKRNYEIKIPFKYLEKVEAFND